VRVELRPTSHQGIAGRRRGGIGDPIDPEIPLEPPKPVSMAP
jgi:hypothetical protein